MDDSIRSAVAVMKRAMVLKELPRTGWILEGVPRSQSDSVAAHSWSVSLVSLIMFELLHSKFPHLRLERILAMSTMHDLPESLTGELCPEFKRLVSNTLKEPTLFARIDRIVLARLLGGIAGEQVLVSVVEEYYACETSEAKLVKFANVLDSLFYSQDKLLKVYKRYLDEAKERLRYKSPEVDDGLGSSLADLLDDLVAEWDCIEPASGKSDDSPAP